MIKIHNKSTPLALTMGDPASISGEISLMAWLAKEQEKLKPFFMIDDPERLKSLANKISLDVPIQEITNVNEANATFKNALPVLPIKLAEPSIPGISNPKNANATILSLDKAIQFAIDGSASGIVTGPINKSTLYNNGFNAPGHTEYIASKTGSPYPVMMLSCPELRVVPVTVHLGLKEAINSLNQKDIETTINVVDDALKNNFGIYNPRIVVTGLNPHAGENGKFGDEENNIITPAIQKLKKDGLNVRGPIAPDSAFHKSARSTYDVVVCMIHDHALIPIKTLDFNKGVNITLGVPIVRTSPDHGTAFDIAGTGKADPNSLIQSIHMADKISLQRQIIFSENEH